MASAGRVGWDHCRVVMIASFGADEVVVVLGVSPRSIWTRWDVPVNRLPRLS